MVTVANGSDRLIAASDWFPTNRGSLGESPRLSLLTLLPIGARAALPLREHEPWARQPLESTHFTLQRFIAFSTAALLFSWHVNNRRRRLLCTVVVVPLSLEFYRFVSKNTLHYLKPMIIEFKRIETKNKTCIIPWSLRLLALKMNLWLRLEKENLVSRDVSNSSPKSLKQSQKTQKVPNCTYYLIPRSCTCTESLFNLGFYFQNARIWH